MGWGEFWETASGFAILTLFFSLPVITGPLGLLFAIFTIVDIVRHPEKFTGANVGCIFVGLLVGGIGTFIVGAQFHNARVEKRYRQWREEQWEQARIAREEAAEQGAYELDIPIKSLCGFKLGTPPSQVGHLLRGKNKNFVGEVLKGHWCYGGDEDGYKVTCRLAKPFRLFTHATVSFADRGVGLHLDGVRLTADIANVSKESWTKEMTAVVGLMEKKFGIKFKERECYTHCHGYHWGGEGCEIQVFESRYEGHSLNLEFRAGGIIRDMDVFAKKVREEAGKKTIELDATDGADEL
jgi:hypothetical protein